MKIGFFTDSYSPSADGVATSVESSARELQKRGHEVYIVAPNQPHVKKQRKVFRLYSVRVMKSPEVWLGLGVPQPAILKIINTKLDIIHGHSGGPVSFLGWQVAQAQKIPFIETYHTLWKFYRHYLVYPQILKLWMIRKIISIVGNDCDAVIAPSLKAKNDLLLSGVKKPIYTVPSGIYLEEFRNNKKGYLRNKFQIPGENRIILTVGRLEKEKSIDFLIKAFDKLHQSVPNTSFVIVGSGRDKEKLEKLAEFHGLNGSVIFSGKIPYEDMPKAYAGADLFVFASKTESQGMVVMESMAAGLPVVAVEDGVFRDIIQNGINGFIVNKDKSNFSKKMQLILKDTELRLKLGHNALKTSQRFSIHETVKSLENTYSEVIENKKKSRKYVLNNFFTPGIKKGLFEKRI